MEGAGKMGGDNLAGTWAGQDTDQGQAFGLQS